MLSEDQRRAFHEDGYLHLPAAVPTAATERMREDLEQEISRVRQAAKAELVPYQPPGQALVPPGEGIRVRITRSR